MYAILIFVVHSPSLAETRLISLVDRMIGPAWLSLLSNASLSRFCFSDINSEPVESSSEASEQANSIKRSGGK